MRDGLDAVCFGVLIHNNNTLFALVWNCAHHLYNTHIGKLVNASLWDVVIKAGKDGHDE